MTQKVIFYRKTVVAAELNKMVNAQHDIENWFP